MADKSSKNESSTRQNFDDITDIEKQPSKTDQKKIIETMTKNLSYPDQDDQNIQSKIFSKREFYNYKIPERPKMNIENCNAI